ncbi:hypothetical protein A2Y83_01210 [Candidatus Falkowbacteria bacterium RBG_13_39_14]|uniref:HEPN domain-containing protein n=1 Tax=Candidatus Falkowbacteria bacterium RBG_13_39_14 TaxID=1797985 RepID=A0A1F5S4V5_9BACT|nr:MAG: hypothetical protein A2Y83_01210 [Candidatus Falkowbacteria bacterium RBG_13_39_14]
MANNGYSKKELIYQEWIKKAQDDELTCISILKHRDAPPNGVCFMSQQMAEKSLKAFLVYTKKQFPKTHALEYILSLCMDIALSFNALKEEAIFLDSLYVETRYPGDFPEFTWKDAEEAFAAAEKIKNFVMEKF